jgi:N-methylhydantoinase A
VAGSVYAASLIGVHDLVPFDMGGTSTDISLVVGGRPSLAASRRLAGETVALSSLDIASIGAGGGSIAQVDAGGILHVGPESAGAEPGPACYGLGGKAATVTDADLVLGCLDPGHFLGGRRTLDRAAAERAVDRIAPVLGVDRLAAAAGIVRVVDTNMAEAVRLVSVRRGVDVRSFALFAFGGAAGLHATAVARSLGMARVVVPRVAPVLSAWGMLATDLRFEAVRSHIGAAGALDGGAVKRLFADLEAEAVARLRAAFAGPAEIRRSADMRYGEQVFEIVVPLDDVDWSAADPLPAIAARFHRRHDALYTYSLPEEEVVFVNARVAASGILEALPREAVLPPAPPVSARAERLVWLDGSWATAAIYDFAALTPLQTVTGPAILEGEMTTVLLHADDRAVVTPRGWLDIAVPPRD